MDKIVRWQDWNGAGLEHCVCRETADGLLLEGTVAGTRGGLYGGHYLVRTDSRFATRELRVSYAGGAELYVETDGTGHWHDRLTGRALPGLEGCLDVDIGMTPATNMLPIRRLGLAAGESREIVVGYVPLPHQIDGAFLPSRAEQRYTCLTPGQSYRYEGLFRGFTAVLEVDEAGLVLDYPETFRRVATS
ncbi:putative glycolipid-binding domain-containing protein [Pseudoroseicyclus tamaricis]|uniref:Putative glycolipid-binding domain-containing protein n=1 Tax=Pseudoroseicyclus tamaricis TaxID=2705421 RepID=A0A6B2JSE0_9RHOB|nr:putative glycolipid-binding domain-containing protein [Pseudoroseicyclus tamaricis]NDV00910.1 putative glycolipid-binding domain-containing protein [Pseudoroseicyclus tamaricis]